MKVEYTDGPSTVELVRVFCKVARERYIVRYWSHTSGYTGVFVPQWEFKYGDGSVYVAASTWPGGEFTELMSVLWTHTILSSPFQLTGSNKLPRAVTKIWSHYRSTIQCVCVCVCAVRSGGG